MSTLTVGSGKQYSNIAAAVDAARSGDVINVQGGTYTNDFVTVRKSLTLNAVDGVVTMAATVNAPNGKAIMTEGALGITVNVNGFAFTGANVNDENGAGIRYEGGTLNITNSHFYNNQNGILAGSDPNGVIAISNSEFDHNGFGDGRTHNIYIGDINSFTFTNSYSHDANVGHEVKSRAATNTITNNRILDINSNSSYEIDLPNGGNAIISGNTIQQSSASQNVNIIAYGEEGMSRASNSLRVFANTIVNDKATGVALWNASSVNAIFANNSVYSAGNTTLVSGPATQSGTVVLSSRPTLDTSGVILTPTVTPSPVPTPTPTPDPTLVAPPAPVVPPNPVPTPDTTPTATPTPAKIGLVVNVNEDAYLGDAKFTLSVDGKQVGSTYTATALRSAGKTQAINVGALNAGPHRVGITFINDAYDGTAATDRNLFVASATYDGVLISNSTAALYSSGTAVFGVSVAAPAPTPAKTGLVVNVNEDAYLGDAKFTISVDGKQVGSTYTATALRSAGETQAINMGTLNAGSHRIGITFINDAYDGTAATDRNLFVASATYDGVVISNSTAALYSDGTAAFNVNVASSITSTAVINVSEDAYLGDAQFTIAVDGKQFGGIYKASVAHNGGMSQAITITGIAQSLTPHDIAITFLNDAYNGSPNLDRNLYVNSIQFDSQTVVGSTVAMFSSGTQHFMTTAPSGSTLS